MANWGSGGRIVVVPAKTATPPMTIRRYSHPVPFPELVLAAGLKPPSALGATDCEASAASATPLD